MLDRRPRPARRRRASAVWCSTRCSRSTRATSWPAGSAAGGPFSFDRGRARRRAGAPPAQRTPADPAAGRAAAAAPAERRRARRPAGVPRRTRCAGFLRSRLDVTAAARGRGDARRASRSTLDGLEKWAIGDRMLAEVLAGSRPRTARAGRVAARRAPPGPLGGAGPAGDHATRPDRLIRGHPPLRQASGARRRRRRRPRRRSAAHRHGPGRTAHRLVSVELLQARRQAPAAVLARRCSRSASATPTRTGRRTRSAAAAATPRTR